MKIFFQENRHNPWMWAFLGIIIVLFFLMPLMSLDAGNSGDEDGFQWPYAEQIYNYYATGGKDTTCLQNHDMGMHGGFFDQMTYALAKWFNVDNYSQLRHVLNAGFGWICILFAGLIALKLAGWRAAVFTIIMMFLSPRLLGHSFNNPKDLIFASMFTAGLYYVFCLIKEYPKPTISTSVKLAVFGALAVVSRFAGYLLFAYLVLFIVIYYIICNKKESFSKDNLKIAGRYVIYVAAIAVVTFGISIALWPYIMSSPFKTTYKIFTEMSQYGIAIRQLFEGTMQWSDLLPWYYTPKYILMTIPIAVILGMILFLSFSWNKKEDRFWAIFLLFVVVFPVFWIVYTHANVYGGWRHAMFAYPPMVVAAGWGFDGLLKWIEKKLNAKEGEGSAQTSKKGIAVNVASVVVSLLLLIGPIRFIVANHPYEYVYFNELEGGVKKAFGNYELDYYYHSTREASEWIIANAQPKPDGSKTRVGTWHTASVNYFFRNDTALFRPTFIRWYEKENSDWDYAIFVLTGINPDYLKSKAFPPKNTVKTIDVDGVPIAIILKRDDKSDFEAYKLKEANSLDSAVMLYHKALQVDPNNMGALVNLGEIYLRKGKIDSAQMMLKRYFEFDPKAETANYLYAYTLVNQNKLNDALDVLHKLEKYNPKFGSAYVLAIQLYLQQKDMVSAKKEFMKVIDLDRVDNQIVQLWVQYSAMQGINQQQAYINLYSAMAKSLDKRGKHKEAEEYRKLIGR